MVFSDTPRRLSRRFSETVDPSTDGELTHEVDSDATVEMLEVRLYPGAELDMSVVPFKRSGDGNQVPLIDFVGKQEIVGDADKWTFPVSEPVEEGDVIGVEYDNSDASNPHTFVVDVTLDRAGSLSRVAEVFR